MRKTDSSKLTLVLNYQYDFIKIGYNGWFISAWPVWCHSRWLVFGLCVYGSKWDNQGEWTWLNWVQAEELSWLIFYVWGNIILIIHLYWIFVNGILSRWEPRYQELLILTCINVHKYKGKLKFLSTVWRFSLQGASKFKNFRDSMHIHMVECSPTLQKVQYSNLKVRRWGYLQHEYREKNHKHIGWKPYIMACYTGGGSNWRYDFILGCTNWLQ